MKPSKKIILLVIDGMGDEPIPELNKKTPLESAKTPNLDFLAKNGICGKIRPFKFPWQKFPDSDTAHLALFGYDPKKYYLGRGIYEAYGIGLKLKEKEVALRVNFATVDENLKIIDRRAGRIKNKTPLINSLKHISIKKVKFLLYPSKAHRGVLILKGENLSPEISDNDPRIVGKKVKKILPKNSSRSASFTATILNEYLNLTHQILKNHPFNKKRQSKNLLPANYLLVRGAGQFKKTPSFQQMWKLKSGCLSGGGVYEGIARFLGMEIILRSENLKEKFKKLKKALKKYDFIFCHIKKTDVLSHDGKFLAKKNYLEKIDKNLKPLLRLKNILICVTADHATCCKKKKHCNINVPFLIYGNGKDNVLKFSEKECEKGKLKTIPALKLMKILIELKNK